MGWARSMNRLRWSLGAVMLAACSAGGSGDEPTVEEILTNHVDATGGADAANDLANIRLDAEIVEPEFTVTGVYRASREGWMRVDIFAGEQRVFSEGIDRRGGWQQAGTGAAITAAGDDATAALAHGIEFNLFGLHDLGTRGHRAELVGRERVDGIDYFVVALTLADGFERHLYINPDTWLIERHRETSALHPDLDSEERPAETIESDFQTMCGVLRPTRSRKIDLETGEEIQRSSVTAFDCNLAPAALDIARPDG